MSMPGSSSAKFLSPEEFGAWRGFLVAHTRLIGELDRRLRAEHGVSVSEFDVLITLFNAPRRRLRMTELAHAVTLTQAGLTHLANRLQRAGLVEREVDPDDRRSFFLVLSAAGLRRLDDARSTHNEVIRTGFTGRLTREQRRALARIWSAILDEE
jgi:DNA-binding MarR family transcriptional regulator